MENNNKGGRPRLGRVQKKTKALTVRYSHLHYDIIRLRAKQAGFRTLTEYVRQASLNAEITQNFMQQHNATFRDLTGLCNNINQLTKLAHIQGFQQIETSLQTLQDQVRELIEMLCKEMKIRYGSKD